MSYKKAYPNLSPLSRFIMHEDSLKGEQEDYYNNNMRTNNYRGVLKKHKVSGKSPSGITDDRKRCRLDFDFYPDESELAGNTAKLIRADCDNFLNLASANDAPIIDNTLDGMVVDLASINGPGPEVPGSPLNNLRIRNHTGDGDFISGQDAYDKGGIQQEDWDNSTPNPSRPRRGKSHLSPGTLTKDSQIPGAQVPATTAVTSPYGMRFHPVHKKNKMHHGIDFGGGKRSAARSILGPKEVATNPAHQEPCFAVLDGVISKVSMNVPSSKGYGSKVYITHEVLDKGGKNRKIVTRYGHIEYINAEKIKVGKSIKKGDVVAHIGSQGVSTGPHLHFEVRENGKSIDPVEIFGWQFGAATDTTDPNTNEEESDFPQEDGDQLEDQ